MGVERAGVRTLESQAAPEIICHLQSWLSPNQECVMPVAIETRHIEAILALAEALNFTRAAIQLNLVQSTLSRQIEQVEGIVGFPICDRNSKQVVFTDAGTELVNEFRQAIQHIKLGIHRGQITYEGKEHILLVGHSPYIDPRLLSLLFQVHLPQFPKLKVETTTDVAPILTQKLLDGVLNMAIITRPVQTESLLYTFLSKAPLHAVMPEHHPAASKSTVSLTDFAEDCWIVLQESAHPALYKTLMDQAKSFGINIRELHHILSPQEVVYMVTTGLGISFSTQGLTQFMYTPGIICRPLAHAPLLLDTHTAIRRGDDSKLANAFVRAYHRKYKDIAEEQPTLFPV
jgi:DNA-binding transcriptional LysR family regulator